MCYSVNTRGGTMKLVRGGNLPKEDALYLCRKMNQATGLAYNLYTVRSTDWGWGVFRAG